MRKYCIGLTIGFLFILYFFTTLSFAVEFQPLGFDALSMGGAGVACSRGSFAPYYNPALLAEHIHGAQFSISAGVGYRDVDVGKYLNELSDIGLENTIDEISDNVSTTLENIDNEINSATTISASTTPTIYSIINFNLYTVNSTIVASYIAADNSTGLINYFATNSVILGTLNSSIQDKVRRLQDILRDISKMNGIEIMPTASIGMQIGNWGFGVYGLSEASAHAVIDPNHLDFIVKVNNISNLNFSSPIYGEYKITSSQIILSDNDTMYQNHSIEYALDNKLTYLKLDGLAYFEVPLSYARGFDTKYGKVDIGGSLKIIPAMVYSGKVTIDSDNLTSEFNDNYKKDVSWGVDLGILYKPSTPFKYLNYLSWGLVCKNINTPKFDGPEGETVKIKPQVRTGIAYNIWLITLAMDLDITKNDTFVPGYDTQFLGGGINFHPFSWFSIRTGVMENLADTSISGPIWTAGLGFGLKWFQLDVSAQMASKSGEYYGTKLPRYARVQLALVSKWF